jgi:hypothetical protein
LANPLIFQSSGLVVNRLPAIVYGYDVTIVIDIRKAVIAADADGNLLKPGARLAIGCENPHG